MTRSFPLRALGLSSLTALAGCLGTATPPPAADPGFLDPDATGTAAIAAASLNSAARSTEALDGTVDNDSGALGIGTLTGSVAADGETIPLDDGGEIVLTFGDTDFAALFEATPTGEDRTIGVVGLPTDAADMPATGAANYSGTASVTIQDDTAVYDLDGTASVEADFAGGSVTTALTDLSGTETVGLNPPDDVTDLADIAIDGSAITGATFAGGTPALASDTLADLSGLETTSLDGGFYGPEADEVGAVFVIDDSADGTLTIFGVVIAD